MKELLKGFLDLRLSFRRWVALLGKQVAVIVRLVSSCTIAGKPLDVAERRVEVYSQPMGPDYAMQQDFGQNDSVPVIVDAREIGRIPVAQLLP